MCFFCLTITEVNVITLVTREIRGFYSVQSTLEYRLVKEDKDSYFSCEVSYFVPGAIRTMESHRVNVTVHCEFNAVVTQAFSRAGSR